MTSPWPNPPQLPKPPRAGQTATLPRPTISPEQQVLLGYVADGHTYAAIARRLGMSTSAVQNWLCRTYRQLAARNAPHAVAIAYRAGLLPAPDRKGASR